MRNTTKNFFHSYFLVSNNEMPSGDSQIAIEDTSKIHEPIDIPETESPYFEKVCPKTPLRFGTLGIKDNFPMEVDSNVNDIKIGDELTDSSASPALVQTSEIDIERLVHREKEAQIEGL